MLRDIAADNKIEEFQLAGGETPPATQQRHTIYDRMD